jgi:penicillin-binding protein 1A
MRRSAGRVWLVRLLRLGLIFICIGAVGAGALIVWLHHSTDIPNIAKLSEYRPQLVTRILGANGEFIGELANERRTVVPFDKIPRIMRQAVVDAEDADFYEHGGVSYMGILRAALKNLRPGSGRQGGSTITQQVVKNFLLSREKTAARKIKEIYLAYQLDNSLSKDEILWLYINQNNYGKGRYGCQEAARYYFNKNCEQLNTGEAALLAGIPQLPGKLDPVDHPDAAKRRQLYVLEQLVRRGHLAAGEAQRIGAEPIRLVKAVERQSTTAPEVVDQVKQQLIDKYGEDKIYSLGIEVRTTIDARLQDMARQALEKGLSDLDARESFRGPVRHLDARGVAKHLAELRKEIGEAGPKNSNVYEAVVTALDDAANAATVDLGVGKGLLQLASDKRYNPLKRKPTARFKLGDVVRVRPTGNERDGMYLVQPEFGPQAAMVVIDPETRHVKAMIGGYGYQQGTFNRALRAKRQPGSSFKPFLYATAFATRKYTPATLVNDAPEAYGLWKPQNDEKELFRGPVRIREALAESINTVAIRVMNDIGTAPVIETARKLGIKSELTGDLSLALGSSAVTPLEMVNAYATFPTLGKYADPVMVTAIAGEPVPAAPPSEVMAPEIAFLVTQVMTSVITEGTAKTAANALHRPAAGKTGTTNSHRDAWFIGFTPELVAAVWVGFDDMRQLGRGEQGAHAALPIWVAFMQQALKNQPPKPFTQPPGVVVQRIDPKSGLLAQPGATSIEEYFLEGTAPTQYAAPDTDSTEDFLMRQASGP